MLSLAVTDNIQKNRYMSVDTSKSIQNVPHFADILTAFSRKKVLYSGSNFSELCSYLPINE